MDELERLANEAQDEGVVSEVIRPAAILPEQATREVLMQLALNDVRVDGLWQADPAVWRRYDRPWDGEDGGPGGAELLGTIQVAYGVPTRYEITIFRVTVSELGDRAGFRRNEQMLSLKPRYVIALQGNGVTERLVIDAKKAGIRVVDRRGPLGTPPAALNPQQDRKLA